MCDEERSNFLLQEKHDKATGASGEVLHSNEQFSSADEYGLKGLSVCSMLISFLSSLLRFSIDNNALATLSDFGVSCRMFVGTGKKAICDY